ncbi:hypothetical protein KAU33_11555 [Candidatus Dependentiae bacterium]|nr:hypothetical protein [Candidatus Dependentiae bacterium]
MFKPSIKQYLSLSISYILLAAVLLFANMFIVKPLVGVLNSVCIFTTILFILYNPSEARRFIINLKRFIFGYNLGLLGYRFLLLLILQVPAEEWNKIYNIKSPKVVGFTGRNLLVTLLVIGIYMIPIGYLTYLFKSLFFHPRTDSLRKEQERILRTGDQGLRHVE